LSRDCNWKRKGKRWEGLLTMNRIIAIYCRITETGVHTEEWVIVPNASNLTQEKSCRNTLEK